MINFNDKLKRIVYPAVLLLVNWYMLFLLSSIFRTLVDLETISGYNKGSHIGDFIIRTMKAFAYRTELAFIYIIFTLTIVICLERWIKPIYIRDAVYKVLLVVLISVLIFVLEKIIIYQFAMFSEVLKMEVIERKI